MGMLSMYFRIHRHPGDINCALVSLCSCGANFVFGT